MKRQIITLFSLSLLLSYCTSENQETSEEQKPTEKEITEETTFNLGQTYALKSGKVGIEVAPEKGGKISSLKYDGEEFLSLWDTHQDNWGSTFWASPQSIWGWPPPVAFDILPYSIVETSEESIIIEGEVDSLTGLNFRKTISTIEDREGFALLYEIKNNTDSVINVAPWEITRVPINGLSFFVKGDFEQAPFTTVDTSGAIWFDYKNATIQEGHDKLKADAAEGWLAHVQDETILVKVFENINPTQVDPTEAEVEIYANPDKLYIELEPQGPMLGLEPGERLTWEVKWLLTKVPENIDIKAGNTELIEFARSLVNQ